MVYPKTPQQMVVFYLVGLCYFMPPPHEEGAHKRVALVRCFLPKVCLMCISKSKSDNTQRHVISWCINIKTAMQMSSKNNPL